MLFEAVRFSLLGLLLLVGLLAVFRAPEGHVLWYLAIGGTEFGYVLAPVALLLAWPWARDVKASAWGAPLALLAAVLLLSPLVRAVAYARTLPAIVEGPWPGAVARSLPDAAPADGPLNPTSLFGRSRGPFQTTRGAVAASDGTSLPVDVTLRADAPRPCPLVVVIHGGSWNSGDPSQLSWLNGYLAARGYAVAAISYRLAPAHPFPAQLEDVIAGVAWARAQAGVDASRTVLLGRSAGGQLALLAATHIPDLRGVIALYPVSDLVWSWEHPTNPWVLDTPGTLTAYMGGPIDTQRTRYVEASPYDRADRLPPTLLLHGTRDELVFAEQSRRLDARLTELHVPHAFLELPWATHGFDANPLGPGGQVSTWAIERFLGVVAG